jgi:membrane associated rhomboid family serine protease
MLSSFDMASTAGAAFVPVLFSAGSTLWQVSRSASPLGGMRTTVAVLVAVLVSGAVFFAMTFNLFPGDPGALEHMQSAIAWTAAIFGFAGGATTGWLLRKGIKAQER